MWLNVALGHEGISPAGSCGNWLRLSASRQAIPAPLAASGAGGDTQSWALGTPGSAHIPRRLWGGGDCHGMGLAGGFWGAVSTGDENRPGTQPALLVSHFHRQQICPHPPWKEKLETRPVPGTGMQRCSPGASPCTPWPWQDGQQCPRIQSDRPHRPVPARHSGSSSRILGYVRGVEVAVPCPAL